jgi:hypothetical protein
MDGPEADSMKNGRALALARDISRTLCAEPLFAEQRWETAAEPLGLPPALIEELEFLGRVLLKFNQAANRLYFASVDGEQPAWIHEWLDRGKPAWLIELQRSKALRSAAPRVLRPDLILHHEHGAPALSLVELDSVPGGIGTTAWLNLRYAQEGFAVTGGETGMSAGFAGIFPADNPVTVVISEESRSYLPEMNWLTAHLGERFGVSFNEAPRPQNGAAYYRFFELFDVENIRGARELLEASGSAFITPAPKPLFEEKLLLALFWNPHLADFWRENLGEGFDRRLRAVVPYAWIVDPAPLPPHGVVPRLGITSMRKLDSLSKRERRLVLKVSGFSPEAWGGRGVFMGDDLSTGEWRDAVEKALTSARTSPYILQEYRAPARVTIPRYDEASGVIVPFTGHVRLSPYYFAAGEGSQMRAPLGGVLATICPLDKKKIHGMRDAVLAPVMPEAAEGAK